MRAATIFRQSEWYWSNYDGRRKEYKGVTRQQFEAAKDKHFRREITRIDCAAAKYVSHRKRARLYAQKYLGIDRYGKLPIFGHTRLYLASPIYGHSDYNKVAILPLIGNERYCEVLRNYMWRKYEAQIREYSRHSGSK